MSQHFVVRTGGPLRGSVRVPSDKSISHRALMLSGIASGTSTLYDVLESEDCMATRDAMRALGVQMERLGPGHYVVTGQPNLAAPDQPIDCGNSGTGMRLLSGLLAGQNLTATLIGDESLMQRPMRRIADPLAAMGVRVTTSDDGCPPIVLDAGGELKPVDHQASIASAQVKSAILLAGLGAQGTTTVSEPVRSRDHTEQLLPAFGVTLTVDGLRVSLTGPQSLTASDVRVPADPSSAAFFAVAATLVEGSDLTLTQVGMNPTRTGFVDILDQMGARIERLNHSQVGGEPVCDLRVRSATLHGIDVKEEWVARSIDEFPVLFVAAAAATGVTRVRGARELRVKETDRLAVMAKGLRALGIDSVLYDDGIDVHSGTFGGGEVDSGGDHRIAMAFAAAALIADAPVHVQDTANVATSFPNFASLARSVGWQVDEH
ncbi:MAG: 3-phosphoshikimate 1-carboxyvinyltransferase [Gammaproteobacteria bacterium]